LASGERNFQVRSGLNPAKLLTNDARLSSQSTSGPFSSRSKLGVIWFDL
jgi:hypothetical protein